MEEKYEVYVSMTGKGWAMSTASTYEAALYVAFFCRSGEEGSSSIRSFYKYATIVKVS